MANFFDQFDEKPKTGNFFDQFDEKPAAPPVKEAGFSFGDIGKAFGVGAAGSAKTLTDVAGADNFVSSKLGKATESLQQSMTPGRQAEMQRQAERMKAAEESGSLLQEIKAGALNVAEAPLQSAAQAIGSFVPYLPALFASPFAAALGLTGRSLSAITAVAQQAPKVIGTAQVAGAVKGSIYDGVLQAEIEAGVDPEVAKQKADKAQSYFGGNFDQIALGAGLGRVAGGTGVEKFLAPAGRVGAAQGLGRRVGEAVITESLPEAAQGGQERLAQNIALQREGRDVDTFRGVAGAATQEALTGALGAAPIAALVKPPPKPDESVEAFKKEEDAFRKQFGAAAPVAAPVDPTAPAVAEPPTEFPGGYTATRREVSRQDVPESFGIFAEGSDKPLTTVTKQEEVDAKLQSLSEIRQEEQARLLAESDKITKSIFDEQRKLEVMEATGQTDTDQYVQSKALLEQRKDEAAQQIKDINDKIASYSAPLKAAPIGVRTDIQNEFNVSRGAEPVGTFSTLEEVEASLRERDPEPFKQAEIAARKKALDNTLRPLITKFNLGDVGLNVVDQLERNAGGRYLDKLIEVSLQEANPLQTMRHESLHALKDLGFFTPQQWKALTERAEKEWVVNLKKTPYEKDVTRYDAYLDMFTKEGQGKGLTGPALQQYANEALIEEAIADAFGAYDKGAPPPPGMIAALFKKLKDFFMNFGQALRGAGFESSEDIFQRVERGELKSRKPKAEAKVKYSVAPEAEKAEKKADPNDVSSLVSSGPYDDAALRILKSQVVKTSNPLEVDEVGLLFDQTYLDQFKQKGDWRNETNFKTAVAQAVKELKFQIQQSKSGLDWYDQDIADAFELTQKYIPSLKKPQKRALFSVIAGIMSPSVNARDNWVIAAQAYQHYEKTGVLPGFNPATGGLWQGGLESANKKKQLDMLNAMLQPKSKGGLGEAGAVEWLQGDHTVAEITKFRSQYGGMGKSSTGGKATDILPGFTAFGPKVGPFVMNINGLHEVTVDVWMTRTFNRYFGQMMGPDGKMTRAPTEPQRVAIKQLATEAAQQLGIKPYQVQSVLWFFEQQMFNKLGTGAKSYGFSDGATKFIESQGGVGVPKRSSTDISTDEVEDKPARKQDERVGAQADRLRTRATKQGVDDEQKRELPSGEPAVRPSGRGDEKRKRGAKYSLIGDVRSYRERNEAVPETHTRRSLEDGGRLRVLGAKPIAQYTPIDQFKEIVNQYGFQSPVFYEISGKDADVYAQAIQEAKDANPFGAAVTVYPVEEYADMRLFMTEDGKSGVALKGDDIVSVFSGPPHKGSVNSSIQLAVQEGGRRLDAFDTVLTDLYNANGFQVVGRMKWNEDYKPDNWDKKTFSKFNSGEPDVVYMAYNPDDSRDVNENPGKYFDDPDELAQAQKDAVNKYVKEGIGYGTERQVETSRRLKAKKGELPKQGRVRRSLRILDDKTRAKYPNLEKPVAGLPATVKVDGVDVTFGPYIPAREAAVFYAEEAGLPYRQQASYHKIDPSFSKMLANSYARMIDEPNAPQVKAAYKAWADETIAQYKAMLKTGIEVEFFPDAIDTYGNPRNSILDVINNNHLYVFPADGGFGQSAITDNQIKNNPALALTDIIISGRRARVVEVFRATHDFFGHIKEGFGFRAEGEENAFQSHVRMYSPLAARAMTAGTRGQNSDVNFGKNAEFNKTASGKDTKYAEQKIGLMPEWASTSEIEPDVTEEFEPTPMGKGVVLGTLQPGAKSFKGIHYGVAKVNSLSGNKYGTGIRGAESKRLAQSDDERISRRVYFYVQKPNGEMPIPESGLGEHVYTQQFDNILPPGEKSRSLSAQANGDSNAFESAVVDAGYDGYAIPDMGMMVILNHNTPVNYEGTRAEIQKSGKKYSLRTNFPSVKAVKEAVADTQIPQTEEFKRFIAGNQWVDKNGDPKVFYHATAREFFEFTPAGSSQAIFIADTPEEAETFGSIAEDRMRREIYRALNKDEKLELFQRVVNDEVKAGNITAKQGADFMRQSNRKAPEYGNFGDIEAEVYEALIGLSPTRMSIMPLYVRAETPFDFENKAQVEQVINWMRNNVEIKGDFPEKKLAGLQGRIAQGLWQAIEDKGVQQALRALGYDGFTVRENKAGPKNYAVYKPTQVKSVTGNLGEYDREAKDIRYSLRSAPTTPEFKRWFGDSKVVDKDGKPLVVYHGTKAFDDYSEKEGEAISQFAGIPNWFAEEPYTASGYAGAQGTMYPAYLSIKNPLVIKNFDMNDDVEFAYTLAKKLGVDIDTLYLPRNAKAYNVVSSPQFIEAAQNAGYDGIQVKEGDYTTYAAFEPTQIKSATGNKGSYDPNNPDIRYSIPNIPANLQNRIDESVTKRVEKGFAKRMIEAISPRSAASFRAGALNRYNQLSEYDKKLAEQMGGAALLADQSAESAALMSDLGAGIAASAMGYGDRNGGIPVLRNGITTIDTKVKGLIASLAPLAAQGDSAIYQRYQYWAMVKRGQRLNAQGKLTGIDTADVAFAKFLEQKHPEFVSVQKDLIAFNNGLVKYMVDTGVLSQSRGAEYVKYADYIPFYRQMDGETTLGPNLFASLSGVKPPKKLKGADIAEAPLADFLETMVRNTQSSIQAGIKNYAAQRAINVVSQVKAPNMGLTRLNAPSTKPNTISVLEQGVLVSYETADNLLIEAVKSLNMNELPFMGIIAGPANLLRNLVTRDPGFMMANLLRDSLSAYVTSGVKMTPVADTIMSFGKSLARKSTGFEALLNAGNIGGYEFSENIERSGRMLGEDLEKKTGTRKDAKVLRPFKSLWGALETGTTASDAATRAVIYERVLAETGNEAEALYRALEVMNFHRKGNSPLIRVLTAAVPFFNARLQGLDLFYRASTGNMNNKDAAAIKRQFWARGMTMAALSGLYWFMVSDDEEYKKQEQETKDNNWLIPSLGIRIPIPFEVGVLFKTIPERIAAYTFGDDTGKDLREALLRAAVGTFAFNPIPQTVKPIVEASFNFSTFTLREIVSEGMKDIESQYQVGPGTSTFAKMIAQNLGLSPIKVDHVIKGYVGTMGMYAIDTIDIVLDQFGDSPTATKRFEQLPIIKRFALDKEARGNVTQYYELKDAVDTVVRTINFLEKTGESEAYVEYLTKNQGTFAFKDYIRDTEKTMKSLRDMRTAIRTSQMGGDEKRDALLEISKAESAITSEIQAIKKAIASAQ